MPRLLTIAEYATLMRVPPRLVRQWVEKGAVTVARLAPRTGVRIVVSDDQEPAQPPLAPRPRNLTRVRRRRS